MNKYDIVVVGGGTAGVACAYNASKLGLKTLLIEKNSFLGGSMTSSLVIPAMKTSDNAINNDFFNLLYSELEKVNGAITYSDGNKGWFNPELLKIVLDKILLNSGVEILFCAKINNIEHKKLFEYIVSVESDNSSLFSQELFPHIETKYMVDTTGDAKICEKLNCEFLEENFSNQPINLRFILSGVDTKKFSDWIVKFDKNRDVTTSCNINSYTYFSTAYTWDTSVNWALAPIFKRAIEEGIITEEDSNYFQMFSVAGTNGSVAFNAPRLISKYNNVSDAYIKARQSIFRLHNFCRTYLPGFEHSYISSIANELGIRVNKRVKGKYVYTGDDLINGKIFKNPVVISNYPIDIHSDKKDSSTLQKVYKEYQLPIESLIVKDDLFVAGRCLSADFKSQAALRIIPSCFSMGEGVAKYIANQIFTKKQ